MRFIVYGVGAIGGVVGAALSLAGQDVVYIARAAQVQALRDRGLTFKTPGGTQTIQAPVVGHPGELEPTDDDVVLLTMKSQHTDAAVTDLSLSGLRPAVVCVQNGVNNERVVLRHFDDVYGMFIASPATHLEVGVVKAHSAPILGIFDLGRYPEGADGRAEGIAAAFEASGFSSLVRVDIMRWKYRKLLGNLLNSLDAACGRETMKSLLGKAVMAEAEACLAAAGIDVATDEEASARQGDLVKFLPVDGEPHRGGSLWQSLERGAGSAEVAYLNGEIALLGRLHGFPTPANSMMVDVLNEMVRTSAEPRSYSADALLERLQSA
jgi:2-dehydropantoate 2-reductase